MITERFWSLLAVTDVTLAGSPALGSVPGKCSYGRFTVSFRPVTACGPPEGTERYVPPHKELVLCCTEAEPQEEDVGSVPGQEAATCMEAAGSLPALDCGQGTTR